MDTILEEIGGKSQGVKWGKGGMGIKRGGQIGKRKDNNGVDRECFKGGRDYKGMSYKGIDGLGYKGVDGVGHKGPDRWTETNEKDNNNNNHLQQQYSTKIHTNSPYQNNNTHNNSHHSQSEPFLNPTFKSQLSPIILKQLITVLDRHNECLQHLIGAIMAIEQYKSEQRHILRGMGIEGDNEGNQDSGSEVKQIIWNNSNTTNSKSCPKQTNNIGQHTKDTKNHNPPFVLTTFDHNPSQRNLCRLVSCMLEHYCRMCQGQSQIVETLAFVKHARSKKRVSKFTHISQDKKQKDQENNEGSMFDFRDIAKHIITQKIGGQNSQSSDGYNRKSQPKSNHNPKPISQINAPQNQTCHQGGLMSPHRNRRKANDKPHIPSPYSPPRCSLRINDHQVTSKRVAHINSPDPKNIRPAIPYAAYRNAVSSHFFIAVTEKYHTQLQLLEMAKFRASLQINRTLFEQLNRVRHQMVSVGAAQRIRTVGRVYFERVIQLIEHNQRGVEARMKYKMGYAKNQTLIVKDKNSLERVATDSHNQHTQNSHSSSRKLQVSSTSKQQFNMATQSCKVHPQSPSKTKNRVRSHSRPTLQLHFHQPTTLTQPSFAHRTSTHLQCLKQLNATQNTCLLIALAEISFEATSTMSQAVRRYTDILMNVFRIRLQTDSSLRRSSQEFNAYSAQKSQNHQTEKGRKPFTMQGVIWQLLEVNEVSNIAPIKLLQSLNQQRRYQTDNRFLQQLSKQMVVECDSVASSLVSVSHTLSFLNSRLVYCLLRQFYFCLHYSSCVFQEKNPIARRNYRLYQASIVHFFQQCVTRNYDEFIIRRESQIRDRSAFLKNCRLQYDHQPKVSEAECAINQLIACLFNQVLSEAGNQQRYIMKRTHSRGLSRVEIAPSLNTTQPDNTISKFVKKSAQYLLNVPNKLTLTSQFPNEPTKMAPQKNSVAQSLSRHLANNSTSTKPTSVLYCCFLSSLMVPPPLYVVDKDNRTTNHDQAVRPNSKYNEQQRSQLPKSRFQTLDSHTGLNKIDLSSVKSIDVLRPSEDSLLSQTSTLRLPNLVTEANQSERTDNIQVKVDKHSQGKNSQGKYNKSHFRQNSTNGLIEVSSQKFHAIQIQLDDQSNTSDRKQCPPPVLAFCAEDYTKFADLTLLLNLIYSQSSRIYRSLAYSPKTGTVSERFVTPTPTLRDYGFTPEELDLLRQNVSSIVCMLKSPRLDQMHRYCDSLRSQHLMCLLERLYINIDVRHKVFERYQGHLLRYQMQKAQIYHQYMDYIRGLKADVYSHMAGQNSNILLKVLAAIKGYRLRLKNVEIQVKIGDQFGKNLLKWNEGIVRPINQFQSCLINAQQQWGTMTMRVQKEGKKLQKIRIAVLKQLARQTAKPIQQVNKINPTSLDNQNRVRHKMVDVSHTLMSQPTYRTTNQLIGVNSFSRTIIEKRTSPQSTKGCVRFGDQLSAKIRPTTSKQQAPSRRFLETDPIKTPLNGKPLPTGKRLIGHPVKSTDSYGNSNNGAKLNSISTMNRQLSLGNSVKAVSSRPQTSVSNRQYKLSCQKGQIHLEFKYPDIIADSTNKRGTNETLPPSTIISQINLKDLNKLAGNTLKTDQLSQSNQQFSINRTNNCARIEMTWNQQQNQLSMKRTDSCPNVSNNKGKSIVKQSYFKRNNQININSQQGGQNSQSNQQISQNSQINPHYTLLSNTNPKTPSKLSKTPQSQKYKLNNSPLHQSISLTRLSLASQLANIKQNNQNRLKKATQIKGNFLDAMMKSDKI